MEECVPSLAVDGQHPAQVALDPVAPHVLGHGALEQGRAAKIAGAAQIHQAAVESRRRDHIAHAQPRHKRLGETAHIGHAFGLIHGLERGRRRTVVADARVDVVLHQQKAIACRQFKQRASPRKAGIAARRILKSGNRIEEARAHLHNQSLQRLRVGPFGVERHTHGLHALGASNIEERKIGRLFDQHSISRATERLRKQRQRLRRTVGHQDLAGYCLHAPLAQKRCQLNAQLHISLNRAIFGQKCRLRAQVGQYAPELVGGRKARVGRGVGHGAHAHHMADVNHVVDDCIGSEGCGALGQVLRGLC